MKYLLYIALIASVGLNVWQWNELSHNDEDTPITRIDTISDSVPVPYKVTEFVPIRRMLQTTDTMRDSVEVYVPIRQVEYRDTAYRAWVSGYDVRLDSIEVYRPTITVTRWKHKRWGLGVQVGVGWNGKIEPYVGVGVSYNIVAW